jgi:hypothetical protein
MNGYGGGGCKRTHGFWFYMFGHIVMRSPGQRLQSTCGGNTHVRSRESIVKNITKVIL